MKRSAIYDEQVYYRIIALWVLCEVMLGGVIHAFRIPVSGLIVGSAAVVCISLIAYYVPQKGAVIKATIIVAIFKMMLSPQAPVLAYAAVFFQGMLGELLFWNRKSYRLACLALGFFALLESGFQRIIVLTVVYGNNFWKAINDFINSLAGQKSFTDYSLYFITGYVSLHVIAGLMIGWWAGMIPKKIMSWQIQLSGYELTGEKNKGALALPPKKRKKLKASLLIIWIIVISLYCQSYFQIGRPILPPSVALQIFIRSVIIVLSWYLLMGPALKYLLQTWLKKKQSGIQYELEKISTLLPSTLALLKECWKFSSRERGLNRLTFFSRLVLAKSLVVQRGTKKIFILTGDIHSGKTTSLVNWTENRRDVHGIVTPVVEGERFFLNVETKEQFRMEAASEEKNLAIGRYKFSEQNFEKAKAIIQKSIDQNGWLIIDEIGPLELRGEGFRDVLTRALLENNSQKLLLVVRDSILEEVKKKFGIKEAVVIHSIEKLEPGEKKELLPA